jgi:diguanylate cyclase (GGDEF)-like protein
VLRHVAAEMRKSLRAGDLVARHGGEEFVLFLGDTTLENARDRLDSLRVALSKSEVMLGERRIRITVSIGIAMSPDDGLDTQALLSAADARLLLGKRSGRNIVVAKESVLPA